MEQDEQKQEGKDQQEGQKEQERQREWKQEGPLPWYWAVPDSY